MLFKKLTALALSVIMTAGLVAASAPPVSTQPRQSETKLERIIEDCRTGYYAWRFGGDDDQLVMRTLIQEYNEEDRKAVNILCITYGIGYRDGEQGVN